MNHFFHKSKKIATTSIAPVVEPGFLHEAVSAKKDDCPVPDAVEYPLPTYSNLKWSLAGWSQFVPQL